MAFGIFRSDYLPYCIKQIKQGQFVILNREYKPLGQRTHDWVNYEEHMVRIKGLTPRLAAKLSVHGDPDLSVIYLYNDSCQPDRDPAHAALYFKRLGLLLKLKIFDKDDPDSKTLVFGAC